MKRGDWVARETLEAVKKVELNAALIESQALKQHDKIIYDAKENAKALLSTMEKEAKEKAEAELESARKQGYEIIQHAISNGNNEKDRLLSKVRDNEQAAIKLIISQLI